MAHSSNKTAPLLAATAAIALSFCVAPASAAPLLVPEAASPGHLVEPIGYYGRRGPPVYPYVYRPGPRGGWSTYFGFVPYARGDYEIQALQRRYPQTNWPPSMRAWTPQSGF